MRERGTLVGSLVILSSLAAGSYWLAVRARLSDAQPHSPGHVVDYFADNFKLTRMDDKGSALYSIAAAKMNHYADDDSTDLTDPGITSARPDQPLVHMHADTGHMTSDAEQVTLKGNVTITRAATDKDSELRGYGSSLFVLPEQDLASSNDPFTFLHGGSKVWARTMRFDNTSRFVRMNDDVEARGYTVIEPHQPAGAPPVTTPSSPQ